MRIDEQEEFRHSPSEDYVVEVEQYRKLIDAPLGHSTNTYFI